MNSLLCAATMAASALTLLPALAFTQDPTRTAAANAAGTGQMAYESRCAGCHGGDGNGGEFGPAMTAQLAARSDSSLGTLVREGLPTRGMPATPNIAETELQLLTQHLRTLKPRATPLPTGRGAGGGRGAVGPAAAVSASYPLTDGRSITGTPIGHPGADDIQLRTADGRVQLLRKSGERYRIVTSDTNWPSYDGSPHGNRFTPLTEIAKGNVSRLAPRWVYSIPGVTRLEVTPVVVDGIMYVTGPNECYALDAGNGRQIWQFRLPRTAGLVGNAAGGINRGVAVAGDRAFMVTDHAHLIALNRFTGQPLWDAEMADWRQNYNATAAPLIVNDLVVSGTAGGEQGVRGFVAAYDQVTGKEVWRFWTVPARGEPGSETWMGNGIDHPGGPAWMTGVFDTDLQLTYWTTGNPSPDYNGDDRLGDNLYTSAVVALDARTGQRKWHFQFTPHNVWDWDAQQPTVLVDTAWEGRPRQLLIQASRNGFFYVIDRTDGTLLRVTPFTTELTWAKGVGADGRPVLNPNQVPTAEGTRICPSSHGAANWYSTSYSPLTGLYYVQTLDNCNIFVKSPSVWAAGRGYLGGSTRQATDAPNRKVLRAIDITTGRIAWEVPQTGPGNSRGGTLATATGLVFFCDDQDRFVAVDASSGKSLWHFPTSNAWRASPMAYQFDGKQYIAIASGSNVLVFGLIEP